MRMTKHAGNGIALRCPLRRSSLPPLPCDCTQCSWYINDAEHKNCFSVLADYFYEYFHTYGAGYQLEVEEIAKLEGITSEEVVKITEEALGKLRKALRNQEEYFLQDD